MKDKTSMLFIVLSFLVGLQLGAYFIPSPKFISDVVFGAMFIIAFGALIVGFGILAFDVWEKHRRKGAEK